jgi:hypothetical protein
MDLTPDKVGTGYDKIFIALCVIMKILSWTIHFNLFNGLNGLMVYFKLPVPGYQALIFSIAANS